MTRRGLHHAALRPRTARLALAPRRARPLLAFVLLRPACEPALWSVAERWYTPYKLPVTYGTRYWEQVFRPTRRRHGARWGPASCIAVLTVVVALALSIPAGYALARLRLPFRAAIMVAFLLPQAFPSVRDLHQRRPHLLPDRPQRHGPRASSSSTPRMASSIPSGSRRRPSPPSTATWSWRPATWAPAPCAASPP